MNTPVIYNNGNAPNGCLGCQTMCDTCKKMRQEEYNPSKRLCICFVCPDCNYKQHELMFHTCEKGTTWEKATWTSSALVIPECEPHCASKEPGDNIKFCNCAAMVYKMCGS